MKITSLELENVKRVKAVSIIPAPNGLTVIGGKNGQGKTSVLDAIAWALGGESYRPSSANREGSVLPPKLHVVLDNGIVVERTGKNSTLTVTDPSGKRAGQRLLDEFVEKLQTTYQSYGMLGGMDHTKYTKDKEYKVFPMGRLINVRIERYADNDEYESLRKALESHYSGDRRVNQVYRNQAGTIMIDCRN